MSVVDNRTPRLNLQLPNAQNLLTDDVSRIIASLQNIDAGLASCPYQPTVNASLDLDFSKQKYKYYAGAAGIVESNSMTPLVTFSRSSIATYFDAMGVMKQAAVYTPRIDYDPATGECKGLLIEESRTNLLAYSNRFDNNAIWSRGSSIVVPDAALAPDGTKTADLMIADVTSNSHRVFQTGVGSAAEVFSVYAKAAGYNWLLIQGQGGTGGYAYFDLVNGVVGSQITCTGSITPVGNGWYRCSVYIPSGGSGAHSIYTTTGNNTVTFTGDGVSGVYLWGAQLEAGAFPTTYIPSTDTWTARASTATYIDSNGVLQTAASGVARSAAYDYDADGVLRPIGLLLENAATNLLLYSEQFDSAAWTKSNATITANAIAAPNGNVTADKLVETTAANSHHAWQSVTTVAGSIYTFSVYVKPAERTKVQLRVAATGGVGSCYADYDLTAGTVGSVTVYGSGATSYGATIVPRSNGWFRLSITVSHATLTSFFPNIYLHNGTTINYTGDGVSGVYTWGAQFEARQFATSYIQTTAAQVTRAADTSTSAQATRAADVAVISGTNFSQWYKQYEGTLVGDFYNDVSSALSDTSGGSRGVAALSGSSDSDLIRFAVKAGVGSLINKNAVNQSAQEVGVGTALGKRKHALSYIVNQVNAATDGVIATTDASASIPYLTTMFLGLSTMTSGNFNSHIRRLQYYPKALQASELQLMTL